MYFRRRGLSWSNSSAGGNRAGLHELADQSPAPGLVGYREGKAVGWVSIGPRESYQRLESSRLLAPVDKRPVWSIVCFVVSRRARGTGVASALLAAAIEYAAQHVATMLEAYPVADERGRVPAPSAYQGAQSMFVRAGFEVVEVRRQNVASPPRPIMRLELGASPPPR
jgi:GNAT superfamily N-acetyltransferase